MRSTDQGLAAMSYAPCTVNTEVRGVPVRIEQSSDYPFRQQVSIRVEPRNAVRFPVHLRMPAWSGSTQIAVNGQPVTAQEGFTVIERNWQPGDIITLQFAAEVRREHGYNG